MNQHRKQHSCRRLPSIIPDKPIAAGARQNCRLNSGNVAGEQQAGVQTILGCRDHVQAADRRIVLPRELMGSAPS